MNLVKVTPLNYSSLSIKMHVIICPQRANYRNSAVIFSKGEFKGAEVYVLSFTTIENGSKSYMPSVFLLYIGYDSREKSRPALTKAQEANNQKQKKQ